MEEAKKAELRKHDLVLHIFKEGILALKWKFSLKCIMKDVEGQKNIQGMQITRAKKNQEIYF